MERNECGGHSARPSSRRPQRVLLRGETYISIYSPVNARYEIASSAACYATLSAASMAGLLGIGGGESGKQQREYFAGTGNYF